MKIVYAPKGRHVITPHINGEPRKVSVNVEASAVERLNESLSGLRASKIEPCGYFDHAAGKRSFVVDAFSWDHEKGIMADVELTKAGKEAIEGKDYGYFSPRFALREGAIFGLVPDSAEVGSFVNEPAFREIPAILAASHGVEDTETLYISASILAHALDLEKGIDVGDNNQKGAPAPSQPKKTMKEKLIKLLGLAEDIDDDALMEAIEQRLEQGESKKDADKKLQTDLDDAKKEAEELKASHATATASAEALQKENTALKAKLAEQGDAAATAFVEAACAAGKIAPKDEAGRASWATMYKADPAAATSAMGAVCASHAPTQLNRQNEPIDDKANLAKELQNQMK